MSQGYFFLVFNRRISDTVRDALYVTAYLMLKTQQARHKIKAKEWGCEGLVTTKFTSHSVAGTTGILFKATVEDEVGTLKVSYLVRRQDITAMEEIEEGVWLDDGEMPELPFAPDRVVENPVRKIKKASKYN